ncbi:MAG: imidazolonepropionase-like amidohydrolase [Bacteroidia bacterium]|jgi:imidazolonepropionase-like amidohydrolase
MTAMEKLFKQFVLGALLSCVASVSALAEVKLLDCGQLLDMTSKKVLVNQQVLVEGGMISRVGQDLQVPDNAIRIDLKNKVCMPGLMDVHTHLNLNAMRGGNVDQLSTTQSSAFNALVAIRDAQKLLQMGYTTLRIPGDSDYHFANIDVKHAIERGDFDGPDMFIAPHYLSPVGGHGDLNSFAPDNPHNIKGQAIVGGVDNVRDAVRREIKYGADWIKVMASGGVISQHDDPEVAAFSDEEFKAMVDEAHRHKKKITAHAHGDAGVYAAVKAGFDSVEHATMAEKRTVKLMAKQGTFYVPTAFVLDWVLEQGVKGGITPNNFQKAQLVATKHSKSIKMAYDYGVKMCVGADQIFDISLSRQEFISLAKRIPDPWYVLQAGTLHPAEMLGILAQTGSIEAGKDADIIALDKSPVDDMNNIETVSFVMKHGKVIRH